MEIGLESLIVPNVRRNEVSHQVEVKRDEKQSEVGIFSDAGRILRPLLVIYNLKKMKALEEGGDNGIIDLIRSEEEDCRTTWGIEYLLKADKENPPAMYTHCELDMSFLLILSCGIIPFANHDHARRVLYQSKKYSHPYIRVDTNTHQLYYHQRPLFWTMLSDSLGKPKSKELLSQPEYYNGL